VIKVFTGEYFHTFDSKGRVIIPAKFREELGESFFLGKGFDNCLFVFPNSEWEVFLDELKKLSVLSNEQRKFTRKLLSGFIECSMDKQGRILLPPNLREYSRLKDEAVVIGVLNRIEIWNKKDWDKYSDDENMDFEDMAEKMTELGLNI
jgi:MraZ protein